LARPLEDVLRTLEDGPGSSRRASLVQVSRMMGCSRGGEFGLEESPPRPEYVCVRQEVPGGARQPEWRGPVEVEPGSPRFRGGIGTA
jgi:hypothetical protein